MQARWGALYRTAYLLAGSRPEAEDLLQEALAKTCVRWRRIRDKSAADAYVRRIMAHDASRSWRRGRRGRRERSTADLPDAGHDGGLDRRETHLDLWTQIQTLPPRMRAVLVLRYYEDLSEVDTARELGCSVGAVKSQAHHAIKRLRATIGDPTTMRHIADGVETPPIDELGFDRRVRRHRRRRRAGGAAAAGAICAAVLVVPLVVQQIESGSDTAPPAFAGAGQERPPAYFVLGNRAVRLDSDGKLHDLDVRARSIVGPTAEGVLVVSRESRLVHIRSDGADGRFEVPTAPVRSAAVSADGFRVAVVDFDENVVVYDLADRDVLSRTPNDRSASVEDFSDRVLYAVGDDLLRLGVGPDPVDVPATEGPAWGSTGGNMVAVTTEKSNIITRVYDVTTGSAVEVKEMPGWGDLSSDGRYYLAAYDDGWRGLLDLETGESHPVSGLEGTADQIRWLDQDTALVGSTSHREGKQVSVLYACEVSTLECEEIYVSGRYIQLES